MIWVVSQTLAQVLSITHASSVIISYSCYLLGGDSYEKLIFSEEANIFAETYLSEKVIFKKNFVDVQHIATAIISKSDTLVPWNFKHKSLYDYPRF